MSNPISLREGLSDDAKVLFEAIVSNQSQVISKLDNIIYQLNKGIDVNVNGSINGGGGSGGSGGGSGGGGGIDPSPGVKPEDLTDLPSTTVVVSNSDDVIVASHDGVTGTFFTSLSPIIYGTFKLYAGNEIVSTDKYYIQYTTGQITLINPSEFSGKKLSASHNHEVVNLKDMAITVKDAAAFKYDLGQTNVIPSSVKFTNSKVTNAKPKAVDSRLGIITVDEAQFTESTTTASFELVLPIAYARITGTKSTGSQISHSFVDNYASLFTAVTYTEGDNGEYVSQHTNGTTTVINTGALMDIAYAIIHDTTGRIYIGESTYAGPQGITVSHNLGTNKIKTFIITNSSTNGYIGEVWVSSKTDQTIKVHNSGSDISTTFRYVVIKDSLGTEAGSGNFNFDGTTIQHNLALGKDYSVLIQPTQDSLGDLGDVWVEIDSNKFTVYCTGGATTTFDYLIIEN